jgi:glycogen operon protein
MAGQAWPLGATPMTWRGHQGVNFAVASRHAHRMDVCLFSAHDEAETGRFALPEYSAGVWHGFVAGLQCGQLYGLRAHGPWAPAQGHRFNPAKLLIDPFARALVGDHQALAQELDYLGIPADGAGVLDALADPFDNAARMPKAQILDPLQELADGAALTPGPRIPWQHTVLYEAHVKGLTQCHPEVPSALRGTYAGLVSAPLLAHFKQLGITTLCLLPVHLHVSELHLRKRGLRNYWGYNTLGFFIPEPDYASSAQSGMFANARAEFRHMVDQLHRTGLEVVLDVVFNHSAESDTFGPTLSWRGLDNAGWYALDRDGRYLNYAGCGNIFNLQQPCAIQLVMDSLRWWVQAFGVDGFRFDLATVLGRDPALQYQFHPLSGLLSAIAQDPVLASVKLIAEPWDIGPGGYHLGRFPARWSEWNDRFRDTVRAYWLGHACTRGALAQRLCGSDDVFRPGVRDPLASINMLSAHDGMTLADLTAYQHKHNEANGENNRDGHEHNLSANAGVEGPSADPGVLGLRARWRRAMLATLFVSQGVPQLLAGDELGQSQHGNNNAYCQDNTISWLDWPQADPSLMAFTAQLIGLRRQHAGLRHAQWFSGPAEIQWRGADGGALQASDWDDQDQRSLACLIHVRDDTAKVTKAAKSWVLIFHADGQPQTFALPPGAWQVVLDSNAGFAIADEAHWPLQAAHHAAVVVPAQAVFALVQTRVQSPLPQPAGAAP